MNNKIISLNIKNRHQQETRVPIGVEAKNIIGKIQQDQIENDQLPQYWIDYLENGVNGNAPRLEKIYNLIAVKAQEDLDYINTVSSQNMNVSNFLFYSDYHCNDNSEQTGKLLRYLSEKVNIPFVCDAGDFQCGGGKSDEYVYDKMKNFNNQVKNSLPVFHTTGNHDYNAVDKTITISEAATIFDKNANRTIFVQIYKEGQEEENQTGDGEDNSDSMSARTKLLLDLGYGTTDEDWNAAKAKYLITDYVSDDNIHCYARFYTLNASNDLKIMNRYINKNKLLSHFDTYTYVTKDQQYRNNAKPNPQTVSGNPLNEAKKWINYLLYDPTNGFFINTTSETSSLVSLDLLQEYTILQATNTSDYKSQTLNYYVDDDSADIRYIFLSNIDNNAYTRWDSFHWLGKTLENTKSTNYDVVVFMHSGISTDTSIKPPTGKYDFVDMRTQNQIEELQSISSSGYYYKQKLQGGDVNKKYNYVVFRNYALNGTTEINPLNSSNGEFISPDLADKFLKLAAKTSLHMIKKTPSQEDYIKLLLMFNLGLSTRYDYPVLDSSTSKYISSKKHSVSSYIRSGGNDSDGVYDFSNGNGNKCLGVLTGHNHIDAHIYVGAKQYNNTSGSTTRISDIEFTSTPYLNTTNNNQGIIDFLDTQIISSKIGGAASDDALRTANLKTYFPIISIVCDGMRSLSGGVKAEDSKGNLIDFIPQNVQITQGGSADDTHYIDTNLLSSSGGQFAEGQGMSWNDYKTIKTTYSNKLHMIRPIEGIDRNGRLRKRKTYTEQAVDFVSIDKDHKYIKLARIGVGGDNTNIYSTMNSSIKNNSPIAYPWDNDGMRRFQWL